MTSSNRNETNMDLRREKQVHQDVEKKGEEEEEPPKERKSSYALLSVIFFILLGVVVTLQVARLMSLNVKSHSIMERFREEQGGLYGAVHMSNDQGGSLHDVNKGGAKTGRTSNDVKVLDINSDSISRADTEEILKLDDHKKQAAKPSAPVSAPSREVNVRWDMSEILLIAPVKVLLDEDSGEEMLARAKEQNKFLEIVSSLGITPEPKIVNLAKHPHCHEIKDYLRTYASRMTKETTGETLDVSSGVTKDIPRLFIGSVPVGSFGKIIEMNNENKLASYLKANGKGLISIS